jgi:hypothetical protein
MEIGEIVGQAYGINDECDLGVCSPELIEKVYVFLVHNDGVDLCEVEYISYVIWLQPITPALDVLDPKLPCTGPRHAPVVDWNNHSPSCYDTEYGLQKGRGVGGQDADPLETMFQYPICESPCPVGELNVRPPQHLIVGCHVVNSWGVGLDRRRPFQEERR